MPPADKRKLTDKEMRSGIRHLGLFLQFAGAVVETGRDPFDESDWLRRAIAKMVAVSLDVRTYSASNSGQADLRWHAVAAVVEATRMVGHSQEWDPERFPVEAAQSRASVIDDILAGALTITRAQAPSIAARLTEKSQDVKRMIERAIGGGGAQEFVCAIARVCDPEYSADAKRCLAEYRKWFFEKRSMRSPAWGRRLKRQK